VKSKCFDYCELYTAHLINSNLGAEAGIIPLFHDKNAMRDYIDENGLWAAILIALKAKVPAKELDMNRRLLQSADSRGAANMSCF
jgi:hypothetical protein